jgi:hypothetical protein
MQWKWIQSSKSRIRNKREESFGKDLFRLLADEESFDWVDDAGRAAICREMFGGR